MAIEKTIIIIDGENLSIRYKEMIRAGRAPRQDNVVLGDFFVRNASIFGSWLWNILRISYHSSLTGDETAIQVARHAIGAVRYKCRSQAIGLHEKKEMYMTSEGRIVPNIRKRSSKTRKESICDTAISVEALRTSYREQAQKIVILSGDGDFLPLYQELMHSGREVIVGAFSSGLHPEVPISVDTFFDLDSNFFEQPAEA